MQDKEFEYIYDSEYQKMIFMEQVDDCLVVTHADTLPEAQKLFETVATSMPEQLSSAVLVYSIFLFDLVQVSAKPPILTILGKI